MGFNEVTAAGQAFSEGTEVFGEAFTYANVSLVGVFSQVEGEYRFSDQSIRKITALVCVTSKPQWAAANITPANRQLLTYAGEAYPLQQIAGDDSPSEPAYTLTMFKLT